MKKRVLSIFLVFIIVFSCFCTFSSAATATATSSKILIDGKKVDFQAYLINGNNYFKLRDLAYALSGTEAQFEVTWSERNQAISLIAGERYTPVGGEMVKKTVKNPKPVQTTSCIYLDGHALPLRAYNIADNNYFQLREVAQVFDFSVEWDNAAKTIRIDTDRPYTAPPVTMTNAHVNSYPMLLIGQTKGRIDQEFGTPTKGVNASYKYSNGLTLGFGIDATGNAVSTDCCRYVNGKFYHLVNNCPSTLTLSQVKALFGNARLEESILEDGVYCVLIDWAGFTICVDSDSRGNVKSSAYWYVNSANHPAESDNGYTGTWKYNNISSNGIGDCLEINISSVSKDYLYLGYAAYTDKYSPHNLKGQDFSQLPFMSYDNGDSYNCTFIDNWGNRTLLTIKLNNNGSLSFISDVFMENPYANFAFTGNWTLKAV